MDLTKTSTFIIGMVLHCGFGDFAIEAEQAGRIILALSLVLFYLRLYQMFEVSRLLGPKIDMIGRMFVDIGIIAVLLLVCVVAFGVAFQALLQPEDFSKVVERPYWAMFGDKFTDEAKELQNARCKAVNVTEESECYRSPPILVAQILQAIFVIITNLMLYNVLIAMFK